MRQPDISSLTQEEQDRFNLILFTLARLTEADLNLDAFMNLVVEHLLALTPATGAVVELVEGDEMVYKAATGTVSSHLGLRLSINKSISGLCVKTHKALKSDDTETDDRVNAAACKVIGARSMIVAPLFHAGKAIGVIKVVSDKPAAFGDIDVKNLQLMAGLVASALMHQLLHNSTEKLLIERTNALESLKIAEKKLEHVALHDFLTDLPNRRYLIETLAKNIEQYKKTQKIFALLYVDIDYFKKINDTLGHSAGDELLKIFSLRLKKCVRSCDMVARLGGDEFIILLENVRKLDDASVIAEKIFSIMKNPFKLNEQIFSISASMGIVFYQGENISPEELLSRVDEALYQAKHSGRNNFKVYQ